MEELEEDFEGRIEVVISQHDRVVAQGIQHLNPWERRTSATNPAEVVILRTHLKRVANID